MSKGAVPLGGNPFRQLWGAYERQLERRPVLTQMATSALLWGSGDLAAQRFERWEKQQQRERQAAAAKASARGKKKAAPPPAAAALHADDSIDWRRGVFTALFGASFVGPVGHFWYQGIDRWCRRLVPGGGPAFIAAKVLLDTAAMGPFYVAAFFAWGCALIDRSGLQEFKRKMRVDFWPTLTAEVSVWPLVQSVNFSVVPVRHQLLVINMFTIVDAAFMSWARGQDDWVAKVFGSSHSSKDGSSRSLQMQPLPASAGEGGKGSSKSKGK